MQAMMRGPKQISRRRKSALLIVPSGRSGKLKTVNPVVSRRKATVLGQSDAAPNRAPTERVSPLRQELACASGWFREAGLVGFGYIVITFPALVFQLDVLDGHRVGIGVEIRQGLVF